MGALPQLMILVVWMVAMATPCQAASASEDFSQTCKAGDAACSTGNQGGESMLQVKRQGEAMHTNGLQEDSSSMEGGYEDRSEYFQGDYSEGDHSDEDDDEDNEERPGHAVVALLQRADCEACSDNPPPFLIREGLTCAQGDPSMGCGNKNWWRRHRFCETTCTALGKGYAGTNCCVSTPPTPKPTPAPTRSPTTAPTPQATLPPTPKPTPAPTRLPTTAPTPQATLPPTPEPTPAPTRLPTTAPTPQATLPPTPSPTQTGPTGPSRPHVVFVLVDDMGYNDFLDSSDVSDAWANMKPLKEAGIYIETSYTEAICAPSRRSFISGRREDLMAGKEFSKRSEFTVADKMNGQGYMSYAVGKWHAGQASWMSTPIGRGFSRYFGHLENLDGGVGYRLPCGDRKSKKGWDMHYMESAPFEGAGSSEETPLYRFADEAANAGCSADNLAACRFKPELLDEKAMSFMDDHRQLHADKPMFFYYATSGVRSAGTLDEGLAPEHLYDNCPSSSFTNLQRRNFCAGVASVDSTIHNVVTKLEGWGENYVLIVASDNGGSTWASYAGASDWPLRGNKNEPFEGGIRTKAMVYGRHPDLDSSSMRGRTYNKGIMHLMDFHMMIAELGGYTGPVNPHDASSASQPEQDQGHSGLWNALVNDQDSPRAKLAGHAKWSSFAIHWPYKAIWNAGWGASGGAGGFHSGHWWPVRTGDTTEYLQAQVDNILTDPSGRQHASGSGSLLFDLSEDPSETQPINDEDLLASIQALYNNDAGTHYISPGDNSDCVSASQCPSQDRQAIDDARLDASGKRTTIATACPSSLTPSVRTVAPFQCLNDVGLCMSG